MSCMAPGSHGPSQTRREARIFLSSFLCNFFHRAKESQLPGVSQEACGARPINYSALT